MIHDDGEYALVVFSDIMNIAGQNGIMCHFDRIICHSAVVDCQAFVCLLTNL